MATALRALIYVPPGVDVAGWERECLDHCARKGYVVTSLVIDDGNLSRWPGVFRLLVDGAADVAVIADPEAMPRKRVPRVEWPSTHDSQGLPIPEMRRPKRFRLRK